MNMATLNVCVIAPDHRWFMLKCFGHWTIERLEEKIKIRIPALQGSLYLVNHPYSVEDIDFDTDRSIRLATLDTFETDGGVLYLRSVFVIGGDTVFTDDSALPMAITTHLKDTFGFDPNAPEPLPTCRVKKRKYS
jgi:hypothetical protein